MKRSFTLLLCAIACGPGGGGGPGIAPPATSFGAAISWPTPKSSWSEGYLTPSGAFSGTANWTTFDVDGDDRPDLVVTSGVNATAQLGWPNAPYWDVYRNTGSGFETTATRWTTPSTGSPGDLGYFEPSVSGFSNTGAWSTVDIDGDRRVDLVVTSPKGFGSTTGWQVFRNTGAGFDTTGTTWATPSLGWSFSVLSGGFSGTGTWTTIDIDGDSKPDLVVTELPSRPGQLGWPSAPRWDVYKNNGRGFESTATSWVTPSAGSPGDLGYLRPFVSGFSNTGAWSTVDLDGDSKPDLVVTSPVGFGSTSGWQVFRNSGSGFATTATTWATPTVGWSFSVTTGGFSGTGTWSTLDIDGDLKPDLVITTNATRNGQLEWPSAPHWDVYKNTGTGFATTAAAWKTPATGSPGSLGYFKTDVGGFANTGTWTTVDLNGDHRPDLVVTHPAEKSQFGMPNAPHWEVALGT